MSASNAVRWLAIVATVAMGAAVIGGLSVIGTPAHQRALRLDQQRVTRLGQLSMRISAYWNAHKALPPDLQTIDRSGDVSRDPVSNTPYDYTITDAQAYRLCVHFDAASEAEGNSIGAYASPYATRWNHPAGTHCFDLDAKTNGLALP